MAEWVRALDWRPGGPGFKFHCGNLINFGTLAILFTPLCQCLSEETLKAVGPFYLVPMPEELIVTSNVMKTPCVKNLLAGN